MTRTPFMFLLNAVLPPRCLACRRHLTRIDCDSFICNTCRSAITLRTGFSCPKCGGRIPSTEPHSHSRFVVAAASDYQNNVVQALIHALKYERLFTAATPLGETLHNYLKTISRDIKPILDQSPLVIPVPLHRSRQRDRGYNQAEFIAKEVVSTLRELFPDTKTELKTNILKRTRKTKPQTELENYKVRGINVSGCFMVQKPKAIADRTIFLVDDVLTSGATAMEAVSELKRAGARRVLVIVAART